MNISVVRTQNIIHIMGYYGRLCLQLPQFRTEFVTEYQTLNSHLLTQPSKLNLLKKRKTPTNKLCARVEGEGGTLQPFKSEKSTENRNKSLSFSF